MRCLALSEELMKRGNVCYFVSKIDEDELITRIQKANIISQKIKNDADLEEDLEVLLEFSDKNHIDWVITDHYDIDSRYTKEIKRKGFNVLSIDDTSQIHYYSDVVLNQNIGAEKLKFSAEKDTEFLLGTDYVMIRNELLKKDEKIENETVKKILVTIGGTDDDNFTLKILKYLESINKDIEFKVGIGPFNSFYNEIYEYSKTSNCKIRLIKSPVCMTELYLESDIAISAGGSSCYELAYFGIPNIIVAIADNQSNIAHGLDKKNVSMFVCEKEGFNEKKLMQNVNELINNHDLRMNMIRNGQQLIDGKGKKRVVDFMERLN